jgi:predicted metal-dependent phosphoesterase TrpH
VRDASFEADFHIHTTRSSDGTASPAEVVDAAVRAGLFAIAITDHNSVGAHREAREAGKARDVLVVPGVEVSSLEGHVLALGVEEPVLRGLHADETVRRIEDLGGLAVAAHPGRVYTGLHDEDVRSAHFGAVEVANGHSSVKLNRKARALAMDIKVSTTGGSDAHYAREVGACRTVFPTAPANVEGVLEAIRKGESKAVGEGKTPSAQLKLDVRMAARWVARGGRRM